MESAQNHFHHGIEAFPDFVKFMRNVPPGTLQTLCFPCPNRLWTQKGVKYHILLKFMKVFTKMQLAARKTENCGE